MKVAVTGGSGVLGAQLLPALQSAGHATVSVALRNADVPASLNGVNAVVHLAAIAHRGAAPDELHEVNVRLAERIGRQAVAEGARFVFISSVKVHGEASNAPLTERSPVRPADPYGESKARAENALRAIAGLRLAVLRPPLVYGPGVKANFLALMRTIARGWPLPLAAIDNRRSFIYVGNLVDAIVRSLGIEGTYLVSDGEALSTPQLCRELATALGTRPRLFAFPRALLPTKLAASLEVDDTAFRRRAGWRAPFTRAQGLQITADWYLGR